MYTHLSCVTENSRAVRWISHTLSWTVILSRALRCGIPALWLSAKPLFVSCWRDGGFPSGKRSAGTRCHRRHSQAFTPQYIKRSRSSSLNALTARQNRSSTRAGRVFDKLYCPVHTSTLETGRDDVGPESTFNTPKCQPITFLLIPSMKRTAFGSTRSTADETVKMCSLEGHFRACSSFALAWIGWWVGELGAFWLWFGFTQRKIQVSHVRTFTHWSDVSGASAGT